MRAGIAVKINLILLSVVLALGAALGGFFAVSEGRTIREDLDRRIRVFGQYLSHVVAHAAARGDLAEVNHTLEAASLDREIAYIMVRAPDGEVHAARWLAGTGGAVVERTFPLYAPRAPAPGNGADPFGESVPPNGGVSTGSLAIGVDLSHAQGAIRELYRRTALVVASSAALALLLGFLIVRLLLKRSVTPLLSGIREVGAGNLARRVEGGGDDEIGEIGRAFNEMADALSTTLVTKQELEAVVARRTAELKEALDDRLKLQNQLAQAQKLEAIGVLAGGIAHDFNNLLTPILGCAQIALDKLPAEHPVRKELATVVESAERAAGLTRQILAFSRKQRLEMKVLDLNHEIVATGKLLARLIGEDIEIRLDLSADLPRVKADPSQVQQVGINLAVNARDAMPRGGVLTIQTSTVDVDDPDRWPGRGLRTGRYVVLSVSDTGTGMDEETLRHVFEPFYTTKDAGMGTGLGLSTVHGIVKQHGGDISVYSEPGRGTTFRIYLPSAEGESADAPAAAHPRATGSGRILLAEDDDTVRDLAARILADHGYTVTAVRGGAEALERLRGETFDLLLSDVVMPGMNGLELSRSAAGIRPGLKVLLVSGYPRGSGALKDLSIGSEPLLLKPFTVAALTEKVRDVMNAPRGASV